MIPNKNSQFPRPSSRRNEGPIGPASPPRRTPSYTGPHSKPNGHPPAANGYDHHGYDRNGYEHNGGKVVEECDSTIEIKTKTIEEIEIEKEKEIVTITTGLLELLTIGETDCNGVVIAERGEYFFESIIRKLQTEFIERWKVEFLVPAIKCWLEKHIVEFIERIIRITREKIIKEYEEKIIIIKEEHRCEILRREECNREIYQAAIRKAWEAYEKSMRDVEFVKEVRFKYNASSEREVWGEFIKDLAPELIDCVPRVYKPDFCIDDCRHARGIIE